MSLCLDAFIYCICCRDSSVGTLTRYGLDLFGISTPVGLRFSGHTQTGPGAHPVSCTMGTGSLFQG